MKYRSIVIVCTSCIILGSCSYPEPKEYFVRPCEFVCDYPFNDTTKWAITCRVWGLLKYYHPNVTAGKLDWDEILLDRLEDIDLSSTPERVNVELKKMLDAAGEYTCKKDDNWNDSLNMNVNLCWLDHSFLDDALQKELKKIASVSVKPPSYYGIDFNSAGHLMPQHEKEYHLDICTSSKYRLLALFRYWNVIYYFFPHKYLMDQSWDKTLSEFVFPFINATDKQAYQIAFLKLAASLRDGHGYINFTDYYPNESQGIIEKAEEKTVVKIDGGGLKRGDIINRVGKRDTDHIRDSLSVLISASTRGNKEYRINSYVAEMIFFQGTDVTISRNGQNLKVHMSPVTFEKKRTGLYKRISGDIGYVDLSTMTTEEVDSMFHFFSGAAGIIFDLRKAGSYIFSVDRFGRYLSHQNVTRLPSIVFSDPEHPGAFGWKGNILAENPDTLEYPRFKGEVVFLINEYSQSALETKAWVARANFHATLIGRPTSGACGQVVWIPLPGNHRAAFSGVGLFSHDRTALQRKGIIPDIEVYPTMKSIKAGKDEILEAAIEYLNK